SHEPTPGVETPDVSIVISVRNEEDCVAALVEEIDEALSSWDHSFEVVIADDGSTDRSVEYLEDLVGRFGILRCFKMPNGQSKSAGLAVAAAAARGRWLVTFDGDLQNDPRDIPALVKLAAPDTLVCGVRGKRADSLQKRLGSKLANAVRRSIFNDAAQDSGCGLKVMPREAVSLIPWVRGVHRFLPTVLKNQGYTIINVCVNDRPRTLGTTKYTNWGRLKRTVPDLFGFLWWMTRRLNLEAEEITGRTKDSD
ncbi:MAG: glycosyltransferase family 2 protein, partial [bacterium]|nr:glycosyltransferase family 2 protein [bacterium]